MNLLLDTHAFIWFLNGDELLSKTVRDLITDITDNCFISIASLWEVAIKSSLNKLELEGGFDKIAEFIDKNHIELLPVTFAHLQMLLQLEYYHRDPFDRIIIAQAINESLIVATKDIQFSYYAVATVWK